MISQDAYRLQNIRRLIEVCNLLLQRKADRIANIREICSICYELDERENTIFFGIIAIESDTDRCPREEVRKNYSIEYLRKIDLETQEYLDSAQDDIDAICREIIDFFSRQL